MKITIIIPAHNEEKRISPTLESYSAYFEDLYKKKRLDYEILIVINGTKDKTEDVVKSFAKRNKRIDYINLKNGGKGYALIEGFREALKRKNDLIGFVDADLSTPPDSFYFLVKNIGDYDAAIASRYIKGSIVRPKQSYARIFSSRLFNFVVRSLLMMPYRDTQCGAKVFKREILSRILIYLKMSKWAFDVDLLYSIKTSGGSIRELPTTWADKSNSHINFLSAGPMMVLGVIRLRILNSPFKWLIRVYDTWIKIIGQIL